MRVRIFVFLVLAVCSAATNATAQNAICLKPWAIPDINSLPKIELKFANDPATFMPG